MDSAEFLPRAQQIWESLDELAARSPEEYRKFIQNMAKEAASKNDAASKKPNGPIVRPGVTLFVRGPARNGCANHAINIACSSAVPATSDDRSVPVVMSEQRSHTEENGVTWNVYDAVVSNNVIERCIKEQAFAKDVIDLALRCVHETFGVALDSKTMRVAKDSYFGPYGWDDATGRPLSSSKCVKETTKDIDLPSVLAAPAADLLPPHDASTELRMPGSTPKSTSKPLIEEISGAHERPNNQEKDAIEYVEPQYGIRKLQRSIDVFVRLPGVESAKDIECVLLPTSKNECHLKIYAKQFRLHLPMDPNTTVANVQFVKSKSTLRVLLEPN